MKSKSTLRSLLLLAAAEPLAATASAATLYWDANDLTAGDPLNGVKANIPASKAASGKLFGRMQANP